MTPSAPVAGLLLAAGAGSRYGRPKALVEGWLAHGVAALRQGGCAPVVVVLGARAEEARSLLADSDAVVVVADDWSEGMAASLRRGLAALPREADAAVVTLVDLPDVGADVVARLRGVVAGPDTLARAVYDGRAGHPVVLGRDHWTPIAHAVAGDRGAGPYLQARPTLAIECADLATGRDVDRADAAPPLPPPA